MSDDMDERIDDLAVKIEQAIQANEEVLEELPDFRMGRRLRSSSVVGVDELVEESANAV